jgi:hypothetical protein
MTPAYLSDSQIAALFSRKVTWFRSKRAALEAEGFPARDALVGHTLAADVHAWLARRRVLADRDGLQTGRHHETPTKENSHAF